MSHAATLSTPFDAPDTSARRRLCLDDLASERGDFLLERYRRGTVPDDLRVVAGLPKGRMLAIRGVDQLDPIFHAIRRFAAASYFPWDGKTFGANTEEEGTGINRVKLASLRFDWFPFTTRVEASVVDGKPCVYLDYDQPGNPWFIAKIRDEIREVGPGLYLGPAMWKDGRGGAAHVLWFAVDFGASR